MLGDITGWFAALWKASFVAAWDFFTDIAISVFAAILGAVSAAIGTIPAPAFMTSGLGGLFGALTVGILYVLTQVGFWSAVGTIAAGYAFRFTRKLVTLFQW